MQRLSSNLTLFLKLFVPTGWVSFFGLFGLVIFLVDTTDQPLLASNVFRIGYIAFFIIFFLLIYFTIFQLKRVEQEKGHMFVTDYFKTVKFPFENVNYISTINLGIVRLAWLHLKSKGVFGKRIPFVVKKSNFQEFTEQYPSFFQKK